MSELVIVHDDNLADRDRRVILDGLLTFSDACTKRPRHYRPLQLTMRDRAGNVAGGVLAAGVWEWLVIDALWVRSDLRRQGHGRRLMRAAETAGVAMGCLYVRLDTFDFEARGFYERLGYDVYAQLDGFPVGHTQFHLRKRLDGRAK